MTPNPPSHKILKKRVDNNLTVGFNADMKTKLYYYWDMGKNVGWFATPEDFRKIYPGTASVIRVAHKGIPAPSGYRKTEGEFASDPVEKIPTLRGLIRSI